MFLLINIDSGGRSAALLSGRADVVFWYRTTESTVDNLEEDPLEEMLKDNTEGVILSVPYYFWNTEFVISKAEKNTLKNFFSR